MAAHPDSLPRHVRVLVVGAGFAGIGTAVLLDRAGRPDFLVIDEGDGVGGTWRDNVYPGAACDVPSQLYSFSFATNPHWTRSFSPQPEILAYLERVVADFGVLDRFRFATRLESADWDESGRIWRVLTTVGELTADVLVTGAGNLSTPNLPDIEGIESFTGALFHSARWDPDVDLTGRRVAVIGTGASAIQIVPRLAEVAAQLDVYQRTAPWVLPRPDRAYGRLERLALRHCSALRRVYRTGIYWLREGYVPGFTVDARLAAPAKRVGMANIARGISDPLLRRRVTPTFELGCKRVLLSNDYYPALAKPHVRLVAEPIERVTPGGITTTDGAMHPADAIVVATGFMATEPPIAAQIRGCSGRSLAETWAAGGMSAYKGTTVAGFPNLFQLVGPNTVLGHSSMVVMIEAQIGYLLGALDALGRERLATVEPSPEAHERCNSRLQQRLGRTVWRTGGCHSWYLDAQGRITTLWPRTTISFRASLREFDLERYIVTRPPTADGVRDRGRHRRDDTEETRA